MAGISMKKTNELYRTQQNVFLRKSQESGGHLGETSLKKAQVAKLISQRSDTKFETYHKTRHGGE